MKTSLDFFKMMVISTMTESTNNTKVESDKALLNCDTNEELAEYILESYKHFNSEKSFMMNYLSDTSDAVISGYVEADDFFAFAEKISKVLSPELSAMVSKEVDYIVEEMSE